LQIPLTTCSQLLATKQTHKEVTVLLKLVYVQWSRINQRGKNVRRNKKELYRRNVRTIPSQWVTIKSQDLQARLQQTLSQKVAILKTLARNFVIQ